MSGCDPEVDTSWTVQERCYGLMRIVDAAFHDAAELVSTLVHNGVTPRHGHELITGALRIRPDMQLIYNDYRKSKLDAYLATQHNYTCLHYSPPR